MKNNWLIKGTLWVSAWLLLLATADVAQAGGWIVKGYEYSKKTHTEHQSYNQGSSPAPGFRFPGWYRNIQMENNSGFYEPSNPGYGYGASGQIQLDKDYHCVRGPYRYFPGEALASLTITPVFRWQPSRIYSEGNREGIDDPADKPPAKLWYYESGSVYVSRSHSGNDDFTPPYSGYHFSISEVSNGLGTAVTQKQSTSFRVITNEAFEEHVIQKDSGGAYEVRGETRTLSAHVQTTGAALYSENKDEDYTASVSVHYEVDTIGFQLFSRIKADHDPTDLYTDLGRDAFFASIAVGGLETENHEHEADVAMFVKRQSGNFGYGSPMTNVPRSILPRLRISNREGVKTAARLDGLNTGNTDQSGRVMADHLISRDLETNGWEGGDVSVYLSSVPYVHNRIHMSWGRTHWRMGEYGEKPWDYSFLSATQEDKFWLWAKVMFRDDEDDSKDLPLIGHSMKFVVTRLQVRERDANGKTVERVYTTTPIYPHSEPFDSYESRRAPEIILVDEIDVSKYIEFSPAIVRDNKNGIYKTQAKLLKNPDQSVRHFIIELEDQGAHRTYP